MDPEKPAPRPRNPPPVLDLTLNVEKLCTAVSDGDLGQVQILLLSPLAPQFVNLPNQKGQPALYIAASQGKTTIVLELLKRSFVNVDIQIEVYFATPLHENLVACFKNYSEIIALLLARGANPTLKNLLGLTPKQEAKGKVEVFAAFSDGGIEALSQTYPNVLLLTNRPTSPSGGQHPLLKSVPSQHLLSKSLPNNRSIIDEKMRPSSPSRKPGLKKNMSEDEPEEWCPGTSPRNTKSIPRLNSTLATVEESRAVVSKQRTGEFSPTSEQTEPRAILSKKRTGEFSSSSDEPRAILSKQRTENSERSTLSGSFKNETWSSATLSDSRKYQIGDKTNALALSPRSRNNEERSLLSAQQRSLTDSPKKAKLKAAASSDSDSINESPKKVLQASFTDPDITRERKKTREVDIKMPSQPEIPPLNLRDSDQADGSCVRPFSLVNLFASPRNEKSASPPSPATPKFKKKGANGEDRWTIWDESPTNTEKTASPLSPRFEGTQSNPTRPNRPLPPLELRMEKVGESPPVRPAKPPVQYGLLLSSIQDLDIKPDSFVNRIITDVDQQLVREMQSSQPALYLELITTICSKKTMSRMNTQAKASLIAALCPLRFTMASRKQLQKIVEIILETTGDTLTELKDTIDYHGGYDNLHRIVFDYIEKKERKLVLSHIFTESQLQANRRRATLSPTQQQQKKKATLSPTQQQQKKKPLKVLSDIDDTWISSGGGFPAGVDDVFPKKVPYPGVFAFYKELDATANTDLKPVGQCDRSNLTFLSAKPHTPGGVTEDQSYKQFKQFKQFHTNPVLLAGDLGSFGIVFGAFDPIVEKKVQNFTEYISLYPDHSFVFIGDNGQGDYKVGIQMIESFQNCVSSIFIHRVIPIEETFGFKKGNEQQPNVCFFDTYIGAAVEALNQSLITKEGLIRIVNAAKDDFTFIRSIKCDTLGLKRGKSKVYKEGTIRRQKMKDSASTQILVNHFSSLYESSQLSIQQLQELEFELELVGAESFYSKYDPEGEGDKDGRNGEDGLSPKSDKKFARLTKELSTGYNVGTFLQKGEFWEVDVREGLNIVPSPNGNQIEKEKPPGGKEKSNPPSPRAVDANDKRKVGLLTKEKTKKEEEYSSTAVDTTGDSSKRKLVKEKTTKSDFKFEVAKSELNKDISRANLYLDHPIPLID